MCRINKIEEQKEHAQECMKCRCWHNLTKLSKSVTVQISFGSD